MISGETQASCRTVLDALEEVIGEELVEGNKVRLTGFGSFFLKGWGGYVSRQTGKYVPYRHVVRFRPGTRLKRRAAENKE